MTTAATTWGDLRAGDVILDTTSTPWTVVNMLGVGSRKSGDWADIRAVIENEALRSVVVVKPASEPVTLKLSPELQAVQDAWDSDPEQERANRTMVTTPEVVADNVNPDLAAKIDSDMQQAMSTVNDTFGEVEVLADEPNETPDVLPHIPDALSLRSHLYLVHDFFHADAVDGMVLGEHHRKCHELEAAGKGAKNHAPHVHEEEK